MIQYMAQVRLDESAVAVYTSHDYTDWIVGLHPSSGSGVMLNLDSALSLPNLLHLG